MLIGQLKDDLELFTQIRNAENVTNSIFSPGPYWKGYCKRIEAEIYQNKGLLDFRSNSKISKGYGDSILVNPFDLSQSKLKYFINNSYVHRKIIDPFLKTIKINIQKRLEYESYFIENMLNKSNIDINELLECNIETLVGNPNYLLQINGKKVSYSYISAFIKYHHLKQFIDFNKINVLFEIGGGFGTFCHLIMNLHPNIKKYLYLDIYPIIYVGTQYLKYFYKNEVIDYKGTKDKKYIRFSKNNNREIIAITPSQLEKIDVKIDFFFNSASFQEMTIPQIDYYISKILLMSQNNQAPIGLYFYLSNNSSLKPDEVINRFNQQYTYEKINIKLNYDTILSEMIILK